MLVELGFLLAAALAGPAGGDDDFLPTSLSLQDEKKSEKPKDAPAPAAEGGGSSALIDFDRFELEPRMTFVAYSSAFKSDPKFGGGILGRAPLPWFSHDLLGLDPDAFGAYLGFTVSELNRSRGHFDFAHPSGTAFFAEGGLDYKIYRDDDVRFLAQLGLQYGYFGGVTDARNGVAGLVGVLAGVQVAKGWWIDLSPQVAFGRAGDKVFFLHLGLQIDF